MTAESSVAARLAAVRDVVGDAVRRAGRSPGAVRIVAATKTQPPARVAELLRAGLNDLGENRAQELTAKVAGLAGIEGLPPPTWHFIGQLQRNKINQLAPSVTWWHSVDRPVLAEALATRVPGARMLVQVNVSGEPQKAGCEPKDTARLVDHARSFGAEVVGLMTVAAVADPRPGFARLRGLAEQIGLPELSMGMSGDFVEAIAEGATIVRLGTTLFGARGAFP